jgi:hypothetical protein
MGGRNAKERSGNMYRSSRSVNNRERSGGLRDSRVGRESLYKPQRDKSRSRHSIAELGFQRGDGVIGSDREELEEEIAALGQSVCQNACRPATGALLAGQGLILAEVMNTRLASLPDEGMPFLTMSTSVELQDRSCVPCRRLGSMGNA